MKGGDVDEKKRAAGRSSVRRLPASPTLLTSRSVVLSPPVEGTWEEVRYVLRWRDENGVKHSRYISAHRGQKRGAGQTFLPGFERVQTSHSALPPAEGTWVEVCHLLRWRDENGVKHSRRVRAHEEHG